METNMDMVLDADRPFLEQLEEAALAEENNGPALLLLEQKIYRNPDIMSALTATGRG
jgi:hypothetical protein